MKRKSKNYVIYVAMMVVLGALIYFAITNGGNAGGMSATRSGGGAFDVLVEALRHNIASSLSVLLMQIIIVLAVVRVFSWLFKRIGQPGVIGEIVAGIVLGPSVLGALCPGIFDALFPPESLSNLELVSQMGLVLFMFVIGMEVDFKSIKDKINETLVISHAGILVPFLLGIVVSYWVYDEYASTFTSFLPFALFMGISMSITAFPVLARVVQERGLTHKPVGVLTIASAANDDVTAWCLLAVVIGITRAGSAVDALYTVALTAGYIILMFCVVRPIMRKLGQAYCNSEVINKSFVGFIFLIMIISAAITEVLGIHALFGAFIAGVVMPANIGFRRVMTDKLEDVALVLLLPLFFAFTGLRTEIGLVNTPELWGVCAALVFVAVCGKLGGCALAARMVGEKWHDSLTIGTLMNTRGLMELVALNIGYEMGVLPPAIFVILIIMALATTFMTTPLLALFDWIWERRRRHAMPRRKLMLFFGRTESGARLLSVFSMLYGSMLRRHRVMAMHYTVGTDVNLSNAEHFEHESFGPIDSEARRLGVKVDHRYGVTDNVVSSIVSTVDIEHPDIVLLGTGPRFMAHGRTSKWLAVFGLFRRKLDELADELGCMVLMFVDRKGYSFSKVAIYIERESDMFLLGFVRYLTNRRGIDLRIGVAQGVSMVGAGGVVTVGTIHDLEFSSLECGLLIVSYETCMRLSRDTKLYESLPSMIVVKPAKKHVQEP